MTMPRPNPKNLTERERLVLILRYEERLTWDEIMAVFDAPFEEVWDLYEAALRRLGKTTPDARRKPR